MISNIIFFQLGRYVYNSSFVEFSEENPDENGIDQQDHDIATSYT